MISEQRKREWALAFKDIRTGLSMWRIWWILGSGDIRQRYSRSRFGQLWITVSMAVFVLAIGFVYSVLFHQDLRDYLPYLATNVVIWFLISGIVTDSTTTFSQAESFLRQEAMPKTVFVMRVLLRNFLTFGHNIIIIPLVFIIFGKMPSWTWLLVPVGLLLIAIAGVLTSLLLGLLCTRFRDLPQVIANCLQIAFFITPVTWPLTAAGSRANLIVGFNPFAAFLRITSEPLHGQVPGLATYAATLVVVTVLALLSLPLFARFRARIIYYL
jgi:lipopolysaccharide transport system permease protein